MLYRILWQMLATRKAVQGRFLEVRCLICFHLISIFFTLLSACCLGYCYSLHFLNTLKIYPLKPENGTIQFSLFNSKLKILLVPFVALAPLFSPWDDLLGPSIISQNMFPKHWNAKGRLFCCLMVSMETLSNIHFKFPVNLGYISSLLNIIKKLLK